jgi:hypothetical protein
MTAHPVHRCVGMVGPLPSPPDASQQHECLKDRGNDRKISQHVNMFFATSISNRLWFALDCLAFPKMTIDSTLDAMAPGLTQILLTKDGVPMATSYGNSETDSQRHAYIQLRIAAYGPCAADGSNRYFLHTA